MTLRLGCKPDAGKKKKSGEIRLCVDFVNLNKAFDKDNYPVP